MKVAPVRVVVVGFRSWCGAGVGAGRSRGRLPAGAGAVAARGEGPLALFLSFTKAKLLEPNMKFQSWPLGDKHIFFTFHVGGFSRRGAGLGTSHCSCLAPARRRGSVSPSRYQPALHSAKHSRSLPSARSGSRSGGQPARGGLRSPGAPDGQGSSAAPEGSSLFGPRAPSAPRSAGRRQPLAGRRVPSFGAGVGSCPRPMASPPPRSPPTL